MTTRSLFRRHDAADERVPTTAEALGDHFAEVLAWSLQRGIPLERFLEDMHPPSSMCRYAWLMLRGSYWTVGPAAYIARDEFLYRRGIIRMRRDAERDVPLAESLRRRMHRFLPAWFIEDVARAQAAGRLAEELPLLARELPWRRRLEAPPMKVSAGLLFYLFFATVVLSYLSILIVPKFARMMHEMGSQPDQSMLARLGFSLITYSGWLWVLAFPVTLGAFVWHLMGDYVTPRRRYGWLEWSWCYLPIVGTAWRQRQTMHGLAGLSYALQAGQTLPDAVARAGESAASPWLRRQWRAYAADLAAGRDWVEAWEARRLPVAYGWVLHNAHTRQDPAAGFATLAMLLGDDARARGRMRRTWSDLPRVAIFGALVLAVTWWFFHIFADLIAGALGPF